MYIKPAKLFPNSPISYFSPAGRSVIEILSYLDQNGQNISFNFHHKISKNKRIHDKPVSSRNIYIGLLPYTAHIISSF